MVFIVSLFLNRYLAALSRGNNANFPCPRCLVPHNELHNLLGNWRLRTQLDSIETFKLARRYRKEGKITLAEDTLRDKGLCEVENAWWMLTRTDVHQALSFDVLHSIFLGVWGKHLWPLIIKALGARGQSELDFRAARVPGFPGLTIFTKNIGSTTFSDGNTFFSILQQIVPLIHDLLDAYYQPLLKLVRVLADITLHARFKMSTMSRIEAGESLVREYGVLLPVSQACSHL
jgi:hypothetical protein